MTKNRIDFELLDGTVAILVFGIFALSSISAQFSLNIFGNSTYYLFHQIIFGIVPGFILGFIAFKINISFYKRICFIFLITTLFLMFLVFIPGIGFRSSGASRWLKLRSFSIQPSEFLKLSFIMYIAEWLAKKNDGEKIKKNARDWKVTFLPFLIIAGFITLALMLQKDMGTLMIILSSAFVIYFTAGTSIFENILIIFGGGGLVYLLIFFSGYRSNRIKVWIDFISNSLNPDHDPMGIGYQIKQAIMAVGSGGILGIGVGMSAQGIPQPMSDSIFALIAEEMGFLGCLLIILLFLFFIWRIVKIAKNSKDNFSKFFTMGVGAWICSQAFINMSAITGLLPLTGIPLPFISYGGTHILVELVAVGMVLNISKQNRK